MSDKEQTDLQNQDSDPSQRVPDGQPRRRSPREGLLGEDELELPGSPNFDGALDSQPFMIGQETQKPQLQPQTQEERDTARAQRHLARARVKSGGSFSNEGIWLAFNKYLYTIVLLFMATFHLNLLGFLYFSLFIVHTFAYYSFRTTDSPFDHLLKVPRMGRIDLRQFFCYCNIIVSTIALISIMVLKIMLHLSGQDANSFDTQTQTKGIKGSDTFSFMMRLIPDFDSLYTLFGTILAFLFSIVMFVTRTLESNENELKDKQSREVAKSFPFSNLHNQQDLREQSDVDDTISLSSARSDARLSNRKVALKRASQTIQDYNFKHHALLGLQLSILGVISAATLTWLNLPYQALFLMQAFLAGFSWSKVQLTVQRPLNWVLLLMVISETLVQYAFYINGLSQELSVKQKYQYEVKGLLLNTTSFIVFGMKICLLIVQCSLIQFERNLTQLEFIDEARNLANSVCNKSFSFFTKVMAPISQFGFCMLAIIFQLLHPSVLFVPLIPITIMAFFTDMRRQQSCSLFSVIKRLFLVLAIVFTISFYLFHLVQLHQNDSILSKWRTAQQAKDLEWQYSWEILGLTELSKNQRSLVMRTLFPFHYEMLFILVLATCSKYADSRADLLKRQAHKKAMSSPKADKSQLAYEEALKQDGFSSSATEQSQEDIQSSAASSIANQKQEPQPSAEDETLRGRFYGFFQVVYSTIKWGLSKGLNFATIHTTKVALAVLFIVTAIEPNMFNAILFVMFLAICMANNSQILILWRFTLGLISLLMCSQYSYRVFTPNEYLLSVKHREKTSFMCLSGLLKCEDDDTLSKTYSNLESINIKLYLPYYMLLITFVLAHYILTSTNYQNLMEKYIDREIRLQDKARKNGQRSSEKDQPDEQYVSEISLDHDLNESGGLLSEKNQAESPQESNAAYKSSEEYTALRKMFKDGVLLCDPLTKYFLQYSLYLLIFSMALLSTTLPLAVTNVLMLIVMTIFVMKALQTRHQVDFYQNSVTLLYTIKYGALISIAIRYTAQFYLLYKKHERIADPSLVNQQEGEFYHWTAMLFGYTSDFFVVRLLSLTLIFLISNIQLSLIGNRVLMEIIREADMLPTKRQKAESRWEQVKIYTIFTIYSLLPVGLLGVIFFLVARSPSLMGLISMFATVIILQKHQNSFWMESYVTIGMLTQIFVLVTYALDYFIYIAADLYPHMMEVDIENNYNFFLNALHSNLEYFNEDQKFFTRIFWLYVILAFCFLQKRVYRYESFFQLQVPEKPKADETTTQEQRRSDLVLDDQRSPADSQVNGDLQEKLGIYEFERGIRNCLWFKNEVAMVFGFMHGVSLTMFLCLIVIFQKVNVTSILYIIALGLIYKVQFYPSRFKSTLNQPQFEYHRKRDAVHWALRMLITLSSVLILLEYTWITIHNFSQQLPDDQSAKVKLISQWESFVKSNLCYLDENLKENETSQCLLDWNDWLEVGKNSIKGKFFVSQYFLLMAAQFARYFTKSDDQGLEGLKILPEPTYGDEKDYTSAWFYGKSSSGASDSSMTDNSQEVIIEQQSWLDKLSNYSEKVLDYTVFNLFPYIFLSVMFLSVVQFDGLSFSDLIDIGFIVQCFYLVAHIKTFYAKNITMLSFLRKYNFVVIAILVIYQAPVFLCPTDQTLNKTESSQIFYVPASECKSQRIARTGGQEAWHTLYVVLAQSIGLKKYTQKGAFPIAYLMILLFTEIQIAAFSHPYFQTYTLQEMKNQKLDGRMRGFMSVENFHLNRKWAYKSIKQQMCILHDRLKRITEEYNHFISANSYWSIEDYHRVDLLGDSNEKSSLLDQDKKDDDKVVASQGDNDKEINDQALDATMKDKMFIEMVEDIAMELLKPSLPVISINKLKKAVRMALEERKESFFASKEKVDLEDMRELVRSLISKLQRQVYFNNKKKLYNQDGLGLNFAIQHQKENNIEDGDAFYYNVFVKDRESENTISIAEDHDDNQDNNSFSSNSSFSRAIGQDYLMPMFTETTQFKDTNPNLDALELNQDWNDAIDVLKDKEEEYQLPFMFSMYYGVKRIILEHGINKLIFYSLYDKTHIVKSNRRLREVPIMVLLQALFISQAENIVYALFFINFCQQATLINLMMPLSALFFALLENPSPTYKYWRFVSIYVLVAIMAKLVIQLPVFCSSPAFAMYNCNEEIRTEQALVTRIDFVIGLTKFSGPASYPKNIGILPGILWDCIILVMLVNLKSYLVMTGQWHYVRTDKDIHCNPKFKAKFSQMTPNEQKESLEQNDLWKVQYPSMPTLNKPWFLLKQFSLKVKYFFLKLQPRYMEKTQPNRDLRKVENEPVIAMNPNQVKPGQDYFNGNFFTLLMIFFYTLMFQKSITGVKSSDESRAIDFDHFTVMQVVLLLLLMILMMIERMLYRTRKNAFQRGPPQIQDAGQHEWAQHTLTIKLALYVALVGYVHVYAGFVMPIKQGIKLSRNPALLVNYLLWIGHFVYAALQLKHGYPQAPYKTTFMRDTSFMTVNLFRIYRALPFIWEMKVIIDWTVTHTCLDLFQWFRLDDAFNYVYFNKYQSDNRKQRREFEERHWTEKFFVGFCFALGIILLILAPILLFSGINPTLVANPVKSGSIDLSFELNNSGNTYQIFASQAFNIRSLNEEEEQTFNKFYSPIDQEFTMQQMQRVQFTPYSQTNWVISNPSLERLVSDFEALSNTEDAKFALTSSWSFLRGMPTGKETTKGDYEIRMPMADMKPFIDLIKSKITGEPEKSTIRVNNLFPKMLRLTQKAETTTFDTNLKESNGVFPERMVSVDLNLHRSRDGTFYWTFTVIPGQSPDTAMYTEKQKSTFGDDLVFTMYNDAVMSNVFTSLVSMSVIGIYVTIVYAVGRFLRIIFDRYSERVIYEELPETQKLFEICEGIFIAQLEGDMRSEKRLYDLLITVYRSPELMIKMTGVKQKYLPELEAPADSQSAAGRGGGSSAPELAIGGIGQQDSNTYNLDDGDDSRSKKKDD